MKEELMTAAISLDDLRAADQILETMLLNYEDTGEGWLTIVKTRRLLRVEAFAQHDVKEADFRPTPADDFRPAHKGSVLRGGKTG